MVVEKIFFIFTPKIGEMIQFDEHIFQMGWFNHQLEFHLPLFLLVGWNPGKDSFVAGGVDFSQMDYRGNPEILGYSWILMDRQLP